MPWKISSVFSRLVGRQSTPGSLPRDTTPQRQHEPSTQQLPIDRKILEDPSSFLDAEAQNVLPLGLTPSTRLPSADGGSKTRSRPRPTDMSSEPLSGHNELPPDSSTSVDLSPRTQSRFAIRRISKIASGSEWSTFGRKRERRIPDVAGHMPPLDGSKRKSESSSPTRDSRHLSADSVASAFTLSRLTNPSGPSGSSHERHSSRSPIFHPSPDTRSSSKPASPANTMSSRRHPRTPQRPPSRTALKTSSVTNLTTPVNRERTLDSPHTFGHPTPPNNPVDSSAAHTFPSPSLPPSQPNLAAAFCLGGESMSTGQATPSALRDRSNTLPTDHADLFGSLALRLGCSAGLDTAVAEQHKSRERHVAVERRRAKTVSGGRERRQSAEWSAYEAALGVSSGANPAWPAEVSREILRLSLADSPSGSSQRRSRDPDRYRDRGVMSPSSFLPFPPSRPYSQRPSTASATLADDREFIPRSQSLRFDLGNRRGAEQRQKTTMTGVKRSMSAIESRNGRLNGTSGVAHTFSGLDDPASASSEAPPTTPSLHPSSAPTPSQLLPSGRGSPTNSSMVASARAEPSTPTPAPRQQSDKSRGKRKAEDNLDVTPPEQKKEGQRATFLLPSESRGPRVSSSSHAPSSYHRKRARLSSTSPAATPAQSRPSSVQETPRSTSRSHYFTSLSSSTGARITPSRTPSRAASTRSRQPPTPTPNRKHERHQSMSQVSIPISAFISPHAPSISRSAKFHMRDPHKPPKKPNDTPWGLHFGTQDEPGSPIQAWCFFFGFLLFPIWWIAGLFLPVPKTRIAGDVDAEKGVAIDDPQIEYDARSWRFRCRVMTVVSLFTYVPFIVLVAIFAPR